MFKVIIGSMAQKVAGSLSEQILNIQSFQDFGRRLERDLRKTVDNRSDATEAITGQKVSLPGVRILIYNISGRKVSEIAINIFSFNRAAFETWFFWHGLVVPR